MIISDVQVLRSKGEYDAAIRLLDRHSDQRDHSVLDERFNIAFAQRDVETTISVGRQLQHRDRQTYIRVLSKCGLLLRESGDASRAVEFLVEARNLAGSDADLLPDWFFATL